MGSVRGGITAGLGGRGQALGGPLRAWNRSTGGEPCPRPAQAVWGSWRPATSARARPDELGDGE